MSHSVPPSDAELESERARRVLQLVVDSIPQRVFWKDTEGRFLGCNQALARDAGFDAPAEIVGRTDFEMAWKATAHLYRADDLEVMRTNVPKTDIDEPIRLPDGRELWLRTNKVPLRNSAGAVFGVLGTYEDVTERRQASRDLADSEERFRATFEQAAVGLAHVDLDGRWLRVNRKLCEMLGHAREELLSGRFQDLCHPDDLRSANEVMRLLTNGELETERGDWRWKRKDGSIAWMQVTSSLLRDAAGSPRYFIAVLEDIEPRRRADAERRRLAAIVEQSTDAVVMTDLAGDITYVNHAFERISGYGRREVEGRNPRVLRSGRQSAQFYADMWTRITRGDVWSGHLVNRSRDGGLFEEDATIFPVRDDSGQIVSFVGIKRDVTQEARLRNELHQAQKMESIGQLAGGIAHDFNNLLTVILGFADVVLADPKARERGALLQIKQAGERAAGLTRQLLAFSRKQVFKLEVLDVRSIVTNMEPVLRRLLGEDVVLDVELDPLPALVRADATQLQQILVNLALNSRDAMPRGGRVLVGVLRRGAEALARASSPATADLCVELAVSDTGCGMDEKTRLRVFEPFFTTKPTGKGTGLGLATVYGITQQSGGFVDFTSEVGVGTTFRVYLPMIAGDGVAPSDTHPPVAEILPAPAHPLATILLVEDDEGVRELTSTILESNGYRVLSAESGRQALSFAAASRASIDLVLSDVVMPEMSGPELERRFVEAGRTFRVLFMSGYSDDAIAHRGALNDGRRLVQKPFTSAELLRRVREALDSPPGGTG